MEEEEEEEDWDPEPIRACHYIEDGSDRFVVASQGLFLGYYYVCSFDKERPLKAVETPKSLIEYLGRSPTGDMVVSGFANGSYYVRWADNQEIALEIKMHDGHRGGVRCVRFNPKENYVVSVGNDGLMFVYNLNRDGIKAAATESDSSGATMMYETEGVERLNLEEPLKTKEEEFDIKHAEQLSIQQEKLSSEEDHRMKKAEEKKQGVRKRIEQLREDFQVIIKRNENQDNWVQLSGEDLTIDPEYF